MTQPTAPRPVPGPQRPASGPASAPGQEPTTPRPHPAGGQPARAADRDAVPPGPGAPVTAQPAEARGLAGLGALPVSEHVALFEAEHARLQRELGTIDPR